jgi:tRNA nucleotidyltransferase (CCA-adding enzyme)
VSDTLKTLEIAGHSAHLVGGCVRDLLRGAEPHDYDIATSATPDAIAAIFPHTAPTGTRYGTVTVLTDGGGIEVTTFRVDGEYAFGSRRPENVAFASSIADDLSRRDFTVNAVALNLRGEITDPFGGRADIEARILRAVGDPRARFREDALRMLRLLRFSATLGFDIEPNTRAAAVECASLCRTLSRERVRDEVLKILSSSAPATIAECVGIGLLEPTVATVELPRETLRRLTILPPRLRIAAFAAICAQSNDELSPSGLLRELRLPNSVIRESGRGAFAAIEGFEPTSFGVKSLCAVQGYGAAECACAASDVLYETATLQLLREAIASAEPYMIPMLAVTGDDLVVRGMVGVDIGKALRRLLYHVLRHPEDNTRETLLRLLGFVD